MPDIDTQVGNEETEFLEVPLKIKANVEILDISEVLGL